MGETDPHDEPDLTGVTLGGRYRVVRRIGVGSLGVVYEGRTLEDERVAIKVLERAFAHRSIHPQRFLHPNIVEVLDTGLTEQDVPYLVMEFLDGRDLASALREQGRLSWPDAREILLQASAGLACAHHRGIVHRDVKPSNCFLVDDPDGQDPPTVKLVDFGIAKLVDQGGGDQLTRTGEIFGTAAYMAPEQTYGATADDRTDIYALGVVAYEMLTGKTPFAGPDAFSVLSQHVRTHPTRPRDLEPAIPPAVESVICQAMAKDRGERFASMQAFYEALDRLPAQLTSGPEHAAADEGILETGASDDASLDTSASDDPPPTSDEPGSSGDARPAIEASPSGDVVILVDDTTPSDDAPPSDEELLSADTRPADDTETPSSDADDPTPTAGAEDPPAAASSAAPSETPDDVVARWHRRRWALAAAGAMTTIASVAALALLIVDTWVPAEEPPVVVVAQASLHAARTRPPGAPRPDATVEKNLRRELGERCAPFAPRATFAFEIAIDASGHASAASPPAGPPQFQRCVEQVLDQAPFAPGAKRTLRAP